VKRFKTQEQIVNECKEEKNMLKQKALLFANTSLVSIIHAHKPQT
jgi:hypothetical protein